MQMEAQLIQAWTIQLAVIFITMIGFPFHISSHRQTGYVEKYVAKTYFKKYDYLIDSEFSNFILDEIPLDLCKVLKDDRCISLTLSHLHRNISGEGSHRRLSSSIGFTLPDELKFKLIERSCEVIIIERLPAGVFADPFELLDLVQRGGTPYNLDGILMISMLTKVEVIGSMFFIVEFTDIAVFGDTNLELPSFRSNRSVVEIHMSIPSKVLSRRENELKVNVEVPLHARYQPLGHGFSRVEFRHPDLLISCSLERNELEKFYVIMHTDHVSDHDSSSVIWEIPCGIEEHARVVPVVTFGFAILATLSIVLASVFSTNS